MVTKDRAELAAQAICNYFNQTYPNKELVIVAQGQPESNKTLRQYVDALNDPSIVMVEVSPTISLASLRNLSVGIARGEFICQWDDDDFHHPARIATHMMYMPNAVASAYSQHLKYFEHTKSLYWIDWSKEEIFWATMLCGAIMFRKDAYRHFNSLLYPEYTGQQHKEEDLNVLQKLVKLGTVVQMPQGHQYIYRYHGKNVYNLAHHELVLDKVVMKPSDLLANRRLLEDTFKSVGLHEAIVRDRESVAFHYNDGV
jgi:glycosyltransferase involved in cell wall biosynthesis